MPGIPVVISTNGLGVPVTPVTEGAPLATVAENGLGVPIVFSDNSAPIIIEGYNPDPISPGPLDRVVPAIDGLNNYSEEFGLASDCAVIGIVGKYTGAPVLTVTHGGEPLTVVRQDSGNGVLTALAVGRGLTIETATLNISVTGGTLGCGAFRINEMANVAAGLAGWTDGGAGTGTGAATKEMVVSGASGGIKKFSAAWLKLPNTAPLATYRNGQPPIDIVHWQSVTTGAAFPFDTTITGAWELGTGWSIVGDEFVHTGATHGSLTLQMPELTTYAFHADEVEVEDGQSIRITGKSASGSEYNGYYIRGPYIGDMYSGFGTVVNPVIISATGSARIKGIRLLKLDHFMTYLFADGGVTTNGQTMGFTFSSGGPNSVSAAEVLGDNYP